jgi:hypothetical protein
MTEDGRKEFALQFDRERRKRAGFCQFEISIELQSCAMLVCLDGYFLVPTHGDSVLAPGVSNMKANIIS